jgi:replicative DNA helicase
VAPYVERLPATLAIHERGGLSVAQISKGAKDTRRHFGALDAIVVDYLQLMSEAKVRSKDGRTQELTAITMGLKSLAKELRVPVIALSQLSRQLEAREDKRPLLSDLRESGSIEQDADVVMFVYREHYYLKQSEPKPRDGESSDEFQTRHLRWRGRMLQTERTCEVIVPKGRHGGTGTCTLEAHLGFDFITEPTNQPQDPANTGAPRQAYWMDAE